MGMERSRSGVGVLGRLPLSCVKRIFSLASAQQEEPQTFNLVLHEEELAPPAALQRFAEVSLQWSALADEIFRERQRISLRFIMRSGDAAEVQTLVSELQLRSSGLRDLQLRMDKSSPLCQVESPSEVSLTIDWETILSHCKLLWRLDLSGLPLHSRHLKAILDAAASHCSELQALILPNKEDHVSQIGPELQPMFASLCRALESWHVKGPTGGLRQLTVPRRCEEPMRSFPERTDEFLTAVAKFCPNLEHLDGWKVTYEETEFIECEEMLFCNSGAWRAFCESCSKLREVNWFIVPFAGEFFRTFAKHPKPLLTKLMLAGDPPDKWDEELIDGSYYDGEGFEFSKEDVASILEACPALQDLSILLYNSVNELVTQELFDDAFLLKLAQSCPRLERFSFNELESGQPISECKIITDAGLLALARLPDLEDLYLKQTRCTGAGVFALVDEMPRPLKHRLITVGVGNADRSDFTRFYSLLIELLGCFTAQNGEKLRQHRFELRVFRQCVANDSVALEMNLVTQVVNAKRAMRAEYESVFSWSLGGEGWDAQYEESSPEELQATLGTAREFVLSSISSK
ncbi:hypothetical protein Gpo141_00001922 [Globisporangium polare]